MYGMSLDRALRHLPERSGANMQDIAMDVPDLRNGSFYLPHQPSASESTFFYPRTDLHDVYLSGGICDRHNITAFPCMSMVLWRRTYQSERADLSGICSIMVSCRTVF